MRCERRDAKSARPVPERLSPRVVGQGALRCSALGRIASPRPRTAAPPLTSLHHPPHRTNGPPPLPYSAVVAPATSSPLGTTALMNYSTAPLIENNYKTIQIHIVNSAAAAEAGYGELSAVPTAPPSRARPAPPAPRRVPRELLHNER
ncbi:unnamed protein product [Colias eurytheme]|nr:unnamed protein product [Colias eurytheme]